jgi:hypothetical protein
LAISQQAMFIIPKKIGIARCFYDIARIDENKRMLD